VRKEKVAFVYGMKAYRGIRGVAPHILNIGSGETFLEKRKIFVPLSRFKPCIVQPIA